MCQTTIQDMRIVIWFPSLRSEQHEVVQRLGQVSVPWPKRHHFYPASVPSPGALLLSSLLSAAGAESRNPKAPAHVHRASIRSRDMTLSRGGARPHFLRVSSQPTSCKTMSLNHETVASIWSRGINRGSQYHYRTAVITSNYLAR